MATTNKGLNTPANNTYVNNWDVPVNANWNSIDASLGGSTPISQSRGHHRLWFIRRVGRLQVGQGERRPGRAGKVHTAEAPLVTQRRVAGGRDG